MNAISPINTSFSLTNPNLQLFWDSVSYNSFCTCPRFYYYNIIRGVTLDVSENVHFQFGIFLHSASEHYDRAIAAGADHEEALLSAFKLTILSTWNEDLRRPWTSDDPTKTRNTLLRTVVWYLDKYKDDNLETYILPDGRPAVELPFRFPLGFSSSNNEEFHYCGYLDKVVSWNSELWISDIKTTKYELNDNYFRQYTPNNQVSGYSLAGSIVLHQHIDGMIIDAIQILVSGSRFLRKQIPRSNDLLEEWLKDFKLNIALAEKYANENYYPMNPKSCGFGHNQCQYRPVCSSEPSDREDLLTNFYTSRIWNPLIPR